MPHREVTIVNALGLHLRASSKLSQTASRFPCEVWLNRGPKRVNAKSVLGVTMLAAGPGVTITVETTGEQELEALDALVSLIEAGFGEPLA
ncbi:MAG: HPr family phosphocarrier protein [Betaproteobacteria bacterium]|nr:HPr family phosphocarrier protein [Betaproteobacteria bacterium]